MQAITPVRTSRLYASARNNLTRSRKGAKEGRLIGRYAKRNPERERAGLD